MKCVCIPHNFLAIFSMSVAKLEIHFFIPFAFNPILEMYRKSKKFSH